MFGTAVVSMLQCISGNPNLKPLELELPFGIYSGQSTARLNLDNLFEN